MSKPKLTYFNFSGSRGEECRMALFLAGVDFEDHRMSREEWAALKPNTPFGGVPILEVEGKPVLSQSIAILTFIGRSHGLHPKDGWEAARHEALMIGAEELRTAMAPLTAVKDEAEKKRTREEFAAGYLQTWASRIEKQIHGPFVGGDEIQVADLKVFVITHSIVSGVFDHLPTDCFDAHAKLMGLYRAVAAHPKIAEWRARTS